MVLFAGVENRPGSSVGRASPFKERVLVRAPARSLSSARGELVDARLWA